MGTGEEYGYECYDEAAHSLLDGLYEWIGNNVSLCEKSRYDILF